MANSNENGLQEVSQDKDKKINDLEEKLYETEKKLNELNKNLENRVIERTVEVNKLLRDKNRFIDNLSHDLGTPLTPIISLLPAIKEKIDDPKTIEIIDICIRNAEYIKRVVNNARELAELGTTDLFLKKENLFEIIDKLNKKYQSVFKSYNISVENLIEKDVFVKTDKSRIIQLLDHIVSNAVYSMTQKGGKLSFNSKIVKTDKGPFIQISIKDTGVGLEREQIDHLFDEFYKTDDSRHKLDSTGLGLTICKRIVEKHGGKIWADSHGKDKGTKLLFLLPSPEIVYNRSF